MLEAARQARLRAQQAAEEAEALARRGNERLQASFPAWNVRAEACADSPAWGLINKADAWRADLLVVGSHGRSPLGRLILGSVSQKVLGRARCSACMARGRTPAQEGPVRLVVGVDGSTDAMAAVHAMAGHAWPAGGEARVITVVDRTLATAPQRFQAGGEDPWGWARQVVEWAAKELHAAGLIVSPLIAEGDPKGLLPSEAEAWGADGIFLGARGLRGIERFLLGSVSAAVAARAHRSVEVVRLTREA